MDSDHMPLTLELYGGKQEDEEEEELGLCKEESNERICNLE